MKKCVTVWNYPGDRVTNAYRFHELGFDAVSWLGEEFFRMNEEEDERLAKMLRETGMLFTVHSRMPDSQNPSACEAFHQEMRRAAAWQKRYGLMYSYTFDFWSDVKTTVPYLGEALETFRGLNVYVACEDIPLNAHQLEDFLPYLTEEDKFGVLVDAGHMNIRQRSIELIENEDFIAAFDVLPLSIIEVHFSDNKSYKDEHMYLGYGSLPLDAICTGMRRKDFDGFATMEIMPHDWDLDSCMQHAVESRDRFLKCWEKVNLVWEARKNEDRS